jgi:hypothetical protein
MNPTLHSGCRARPAHWGVTGRFGAESGDVWSSWSSSATVWGPTSCSVRPPWSPMRVMVQRSPFFTQSVAVQAEPARSLFDRRAWRPAVIRAGIPSITYHGLRHFVAILVAAGCNVREVSEWAGHSSVASTLTRYGGLFEDGSKAAVDRLDVLLRGASSRLLTLAVGDPRSGHSNLPKTSRYQQ